MEMDFVYQFKCTQARYSHIKCYNGSNWSMVSFPGLEYSFHHLQPFSGGQLEKQGTGNGDGDENGKQELIVTMHIYLTRHSN